MAWLVITNNPDWEYSNDPSNDDLFQGLAAIQAKAVANDPPTEIPIEDIYTNNHTAGIRQFTHPVTADIMEVYVYCREITGPASGRGELSKTFWDDQV